MVDYHRRLVYGKLIDKTLPDADYSELAEQLYGQPYNSDVARRMLYGSCKTLQQLEGEILCDEPVSDDGEAIEAKRIELRKERYRLMDQRREHNKMLTALGRSEHLEERLVQAAEKLNETKPLIQRDLCQPYGDNEAVLVLSDWHYGLKAQNIWNRYDTAECVRRAGNIVASAVARLRLHECVRLHVLILGDMFHGAIHTSARVASEELVCDQLMQVSELLAESIAKLAEAVPETIVYSTYGNHARTVQNKNDSIHRDNMERLIPWWLKQRFVGRQDIIVADESDSEFIHFKVGLSGICATHGDCDTVKGAPKLMSTMFTKRYHKSVDCVILADKHHREEFEELGISSLIAGALCGTDDYANSKRLYSTPEQLLLIFSGDVGLDATYHLQCSG